MKTLFLTLVMFLGGLAISGKAYSQEDQIYCARTNSDHYLPYSATAGKFLGGDNSGATTLSRCEKYIATRQVALFVPIRERTFFPIARELASELVDKIPVQRPLSVARNI